MAYLVDDDTVGGGSAGTEEAEEGVWGGILGAEGGVGCGVAADGGESGVGYTHDQELGLELVFEAGANIGVWLWEGWICERFVRFEKGRE